MNSTEKEVVEMEEIVRSCETIVNYLRRSLEDKKSKAKVVVKRQKVKPLV